MSTAWENICLGHGSPGCRLSCRLRHPLLDLVGIWALPWVLSQLCSPCLLLVGVIIPPTLVLYSSLHLLHPAISSFPSFPPPFSLLPSLSCWTHPLVRSPLPSVETLCPLSKPQRSWDMQITTRVNFFVLFSWQAGWKVVAGWIWPTDCSLNTPDLVQLPVSKEALRRYINLKTDR